MKKADIAVSSFFVGIVAGAAMMAVSLADPDDTDAMVAEIAAYDACLQQAGRMRCRMTPQDFVRYYELKRRIFARRKP